MQLMVAALVVMVALVGCGRGGYGEAPAPTAGPTALAPATPTTSLTPIAVADLPSQAQKTLALIRAGGPFPYKQDGVVFQNRERILPKQPSGYYHEYTVKKPGESDRGPWRLVTGENGAVFWTSDHYASFEEVVQP